jgi:hypothetical protein
VSDVPKRLDTSSLTRALTQVVELTSSNTTAHFHLDLLETWAVERKHTLDAYAVGELPNGERGAKPVVVAREACALKDLYTLLLTLTDANVDTQGVSSSELGYVLAQLKAFDVLDDLGAAHGILQNSARPGCVADPLPIGQG